MRRLGSKLRIYPLLLFSPDLLAFLRGALEQLSAQNYVPHGQDLDGVSNAYILVILISLASEMGIDNSKLSATDSIRVDDA